MPGVKRSARQLCSGLAVNSLSPIKRISHFLSCKGAEEMGQGARGKLGLRAGKTGFFGGIRILVVTQGRKEDTRS